MRHRARWVTGLVCFDGARFGDGIFSFHVSATLCAFYFNVLL